MNDTTPSQARQEPAPGRYNPPRRLHTPPGTQALGMWLMLAALAVLFVAGMLAFVIIRVSGNAAPPLRSIEMPLVLWLSTGAILVSSYTIHRALDNVVHERQDRFRKAMIATLLLAVPFFLAQGAGLATMLGRAAEAEAGAPLMRAIVFLIVLHALHLVAGLIPLAYVTKRAHAGRYDHEYHTPVRNLALYWHFLDAVWLVMFLTFLLLG